ncbi:MAG TPA: ribonuclease HII, partial [Lachnospiraceae bacterium]|nr:ribonuclease HII [Lachnospiraceae bacterium]
MTEKQKAKLEQEKLRAAGMRAFEQEAAGQYGKDGLICGIDEAGRGPLAGPVAAGAVILPADHEILWLNDSKKLSPKKRDMLYDQIREEALAWAVVMIGPDRIDRINILQADYEAMRLAVQA